MKNHPNFFKAFLVTILLLSSLGTGLIAQTSAQTLPPPTIYLPLVASTNKSASGSPWSMAAANPQRTSWTPEEVKGNLSPIWYKPFEPYIQPKVQIITANSMLYISTSKGLYALDAETGAEKWVFPTEMPLGNSPTIYNNIAYVGGLDHKLYAIDAFTGKEIWNFEANAGFETNPLVVGDKVFLGNRDGYFYAIYIQGAKTGQLAWTYQTQGPILFSAAYKDGVVFFASDDSHAYAINADSGTLVWKSAKLSGAGFHSWWPVVYRDRVIFAGSSNYRTVDPGSPSLIQLQKEDIFPNYAKDPRGTLVGPLGHAPGDWVQNTLTLDASRILNYFNSKPWRKTYFVLDRFTGKEREVAPVLWINPQDGNQYPPVVGGDGVLYQNNVYMSDPYIPGGQISGWKIGTPYISIISSDWGADDEPEAASAGGNLIYWNLCCSRQAGSIDISKPFTTFTPPSGKRDKNREFLYYNYDLGDLAPGFDVRVYNQRDNNGDYAATAVFDSPYGVYGFHGDQNPPIPYHGKVYMHDGNTVFAFGNTSSQGRKLPDAKIVIASKAKLNTPSIDELKSELTVQVQKIVNAGHLLPGYSSTGLFGTKGKTCGDDLTDYWHNPGDTLYTLILSLPYLPAGLQQQTRAYLQSEFSAYPPYIINHIGWQAGTPRQIFDFPPEVKADLKNYPPEQANYDFAGWRLAPQSFYALW
jgi:hypothetical protein